MAHSIHLTQPIIYYLLSGVVIAVFVGLTAIPSQRIASDAKFEGVFLLSACVALFTCRWPSFL